MTNANMSYYQLSPTPFVKYLNIYMKRMLMYSVVTIILLVAGYYVFMFSIRSADPFEYVRFDTSEDLKAIDWIYDKDSESIKLTESIPRIYMLTRKNYRIKLDITNTADAGKVFIYIINEEAHFKLKGQYIYEYYTRKGSAFYVFSALRKYYATGAKKSMLEFSVVDDTDKTIGTESLPYEILLGGVRYSYDLL